MGDLNEEMKELRNHLRPVPWTDKRSANVLGRIKRQRRRFTLSTVALGSAVLAMAASIVIIWFAQGRTNQQQSARVTLPSVPVSSKSALKGIELGDGSRAVGPGGGALILVSETDSQVSFTLASGKAWFDVKPSDKRRVEVIIEDVRVDVSGTEFVVEVVGEFVHVWVHSGEAQVSGPDGVSSLGEGEERRFPVRMSVQDVPEKVLIPNDDGHNPVKKHTAVKTPLSDKNRLVEEKRRAVEGREKVAPASRLEERNEASRASKDETRIDENAVKSGRLPTVARLWERADAARRKGKDTEAIRALASLVNDHANDPRAALAAFTLGRVLINSNRQHATAARAFAKARKLSPGGPLAEDALFREIEAWYAAKDNRRVESRSAKYVRLFPKGRYRRQIKELLGRP